MYHRLAAQFPSIPLHQAQPGQRLQDSWGLSLQLHFWWPRALKMLGMRSRELLLAFNAVLGAAGEGRLTERQWWGEELGLEVGNGREAKDGEAQPGETGAYGQCLHGLRGGQGESRGAEERLQKTSDGEKGWGCTGVWDVEAGTGTSSRRRKV